jgi:hypothetical protein
MSSPVIYSVDAIINSVINNHTELTIEQLLENYLAGILRTKRLQLVQNLILATSEADSQVVEIASTIWTYVMSHKLWEPKYSTLEAFKESIAYKDTIHDLLQKHGTLEKRQRLDSRSILANWGSSPSAALPVEIRPPKFGRDLLQFLSRLSKICPLDKAVVLLKEQVFQRYREAQYSSHSTKIKPYLVAKDVLYVYQNLQSRIVSEDNQLEEGPSRYV